MASMHARAYTHTHTHTYNTLVQEQPMPEVIKPRIGSYSKVQIYHNMIYD